MKIIDALKTLYEHSSEKIIFTDNDLKAQWRSNDELPEFIMPYNIKLTKNTTVKMPVTKTTVCRYDDGNKRYTLTISPVSEDGKPAGYLIHCLTEHEVDRLAMRSTLKDRLRNDLESVRFKAGSIISLLNKQNKIMLNDEQQEYSKFDSKAREKILGIMAATANYEELSRYLGDDISCESKFISVALDDLAKRVRPRAEKAGYVFECNINAMVHMDMNVERFEAAVSNLITNAYMYNSGEEKKCLVELYTEDKDVILSVTDNGDGIPEDKLQLLQDPLEYFSNDDLNESLGLTVAMMYCETFGGKLSIESKLGEYTKVTMRFFDPGNEIPREFRQYVRPLSFALDNTGCILGKCFGYFNDDSY